MDGHEQVSFSSSLVLYLVNQLLGVVPGVVSDIPKTTFSAVAWSSIGLRLVRFSFFSI